MSRVTVSPKYQVVIPKAVRESMRIRPGDQVEVFQYEGRIEFVPVRPMREMRGLLKGLNTRVRRDKDRA